MKSWKVSLVARLYGAPAYGLGLLVRWVGWGGGGGPMGARLRSVWFRRGGAQSPMWTLAMSQGGSNQVSPARLGIPGRQADARPQGTAVKAEPKVDMG